MPHTSKAGPCHILGTSSQLQLLLVEHAHDADPSPPPPFSTKHAGSNELKRSTVDCCWLLMQLPSLHGSAAGPSWAGAPLQPASIDAAVRATEGMVCTQQMRLSWHLCSIPTCISASSMLCRHRLWMVSVLCRHAYRQEPCGCCAGPWVLCWPEAKEIAARCTSRAGLSKACHKISRFQHARLMSAARPCLSGQNDGCRTAGDDWW